MRCDLYGRIFIFLIHTILCPLKIIKNKEMLTCGAGKIRL